MNYILPEQLGQPCPVLHKPTGSNSSDQDDHRIQSQQSLPHHDSITKHLLRKVYQIVSQNNTSTTPKNETSFKSKIIIWSSVKASNTLMMTSIKNTNTWKHDTPYRRPSVVMIRIDSLPGSLACLH